MEIRGPLMRLFSVMSRSFSSAAADASEVAKVKTKRKRKTLFEVARFLPDWGIGYKFFKTHWDPNDYYQITRINLYKDGIHGKAWGVFHKTDYCFYDGNNRLQGCGRDPTEHKFRQAKAKSPAED